MVRIYPNNRAREMRHRPPLQLNPESILDFGKYRGFVLKDVPLYYREWLLKEEIIQIIKDETPGWRDVSGITLAKGSIGVNIKPNTSLSYVDFT